MRAILSVYDKTGVVAFGRKLSKSGISIISTGGTYKELSNSAIEVTAINEVTNFPEILDGLNTLFPNTLHRASQQMPWFSYPHPLSRPR